MISCFFKKKKKKNVIKIKFKHTSVQRHMNCVLEQFRFNLMVIQHAHDIFGRLYLLSFFLLLMNNHFWKFL